MSYGINLEQIMQMKGAQGGAGGLMQGQPPVMPPPQMPQVPGMNQLPQMGGGGGGTDFNALAQMMAGPAPEIQQRRSPLGGFSGFPGQGGGLLGETAPQMSSPLQQAPPAMIQPNQFMPGGFPSGFMF